VPANGDITSRQYGQAVPGLHTGLTRSRHPALPPAKRALNRTYLSDLERGKETEQVRRILRVLKELGIRMTLDRADW